VKRKSIAIVIAALMAIAALSTAGVAAADGSHHHHKDKLLKFGVFTDRKHKWDDDKKVGTLKQEKKGKHTFDLNAKGLKENTKYKLVFEFKKSYKDDKTIAKRIKTNDDGKIKDKDVKIDLDFAKWAHKKGDDAGHFELVKA